MLRRFTLRFALIAAVALVMSLARMPLAAQDATVQPPISVTSTEPQQVISGQGGILSVFGANFTENTTVRIVGVGLLPVTFVNSGALTAALPTDLPPGQFGIEVSTQGGGTVMSPNTLTVRPPATEIPTLAPPTMIPSVVPTSEPATPVPGQPSLVVREFTAIPSVVEPGAPVALTFVLVNQGNRTAQGASVSIDTTGKFVPANGQGSVMLPDMPPASSVQLTLNVLAAQDAPAGPTSVPITMAYRDFEGKTYTGSANLGVEIAAVDETTQLTVLRYEIEPALAVPGDPVNLRITVSNTGNQVATRAQLRVSGDENILLAGRQGDTFPLGDLPPGAEATAVLPMIVNPAAEAGPQAQPVMLSYTRAGEVKQITSSITIQVARVIKPEPLILLDSYSIGDDRDVLRPGDRFTLSLTLRNVGQADAGDMIVVFGTVESTSTGGDSGSGSGSGTGSTTTTTTSSGNSFAPLGGGDTLYAGTLAAADSLDLRQEFIVNSTVTSGIYSLPVTVRYQKSDGSTAQQNLRASVIVIAPLRIQTNLASPLPETTNVGEPLPVALTVTNNGSSAFNITSAKVTADNADVLEGAEILLSPIKGDDDETISALIMPSEEGAYTVTFTLTYVDDLNREQTMVLPFEGQAVTPPPPPDMPPEMVTPVTPQQEEENFIGRLLLGFLGLGG